MTAKRVQKTRRKGGGTPTVVRMTNNRPWSDVEIRLLRRLVLRGRPASAICSEFQKLGRSSRDVLDEVYVLIFAGAANMVGIDRALFVLMGAASPDPADDARYRLQGRPARAIDVVWKANQVLNNFGHPPIAYPNMVGRHEVMA